jgi:hypothetical protein
MLFCVAALLFSCNTEKRMHNNAMKYFYTHPDTAAAFCGKVYPPRDSAAPIVIDSSKKADNIDYTPKINKLEDIANELLERATRDSIGAARVSKECADIVSNYKSQLKGLISQIGELKDQYKKCQSDSVYISQKIYRENVAKVISLGNIINFMKAEYDKQTDELQSEKEKNKKLHKINLILYLIIGAGVVYTGVRFYLKLKTAWLK